MRVLEGETFSDLRDPGRTVIEDVELRRCTFDRCTLSPVLDVSDRSTVRNVRLVGCEIVRAYIGGPILDDVVVDGLKVRGLLQLWAPALRHVILRGRIGRVMVSPRVAPTLASDRQQREFDTANGAFYDKVDWGIDLREADMDEIDLSGVPGRMVRADPRDSALVTRESALRGRWRQVDLSGTWWGIALEHLLSSSYDSAALVAPRRHRSYKRLVDGLKLLRDEGIAEPI